MRADVREAKDLYDRLTDLPDFDRDLQIPPEAADREALIQRAVASLAACRCDGRHVSAPSPWHAWLWLWHRTRIGRRGGRAFLFRGHTCSSFNDVRPSLLRPTVTPEDARRARVATRILSLMVHEREIMGALRDDDSEVIGAAFAQHYGIKTTFLDVTVDPAVAVWFACGEHQGPAGTETSSVFVFDWEHCHLLDIRGIIPPPMPWAYRLIRQRGLFLDMERIGALATEDIPFEITFPREHAEAFAVRRAGEHHDVYPRTPDFAELMQWVSSEAALSSGEDIPASAVTAIRGKKQRSLLEHQSLQMFGISLADLKATTGHRPGVREALSRDLLARYEHLEVFVNHLCFTREHLDEQRTRALRASNMPLIDLYTASVCRLLRSGKTEGLNVALLKEILRAFEHQCSSACTPGANDEPMPD